MLWNDSIIVIFKLYASKPCAGDFDRALCLAGLVPVNKYQTLGLAGLVPVGDSGLRLAGFILILVVSFELEDRYQSHPHYRQLLANVVVDALSCKAMIELRTMFACLSLLDNGSLLVELQVKIVWIEQIKSKQLEDKSLGLRFCQVENGNTVDFGLNDEGVLYFQGRICIPKDTDLRKTLLREVHSSLYGMHPGGNKMYRDLREVKAEHQLLSRLLQPVKILMSKWKRVTMDFVSGLPLMSSKKDFLWVIVDQLTKTAHFILVRTDYSLQKLDKLYVSEVVRLHGVPVSIMSDRDPCFTSRF
ncbi:uncharacterized protein LOC128290548 [Gossypium arboreum]|uniref:uncharacterized protein LOC128290548 n=1 Tax=Gossypium arboreum TaxID=29729 RepID=UPI0022F165B5|nr:uncharacterized protein LOC128290548 [Gossypium arboreum]